MYKISRCLKMLEIQERHRGKEGISDGVINIIII